MNKLAKRIVIVAVSGVVITGTLASYAHNRMSDPDSRAEWVVSKISKELELDETQRAKLNTLKEVIVSKRKEMRSEHSSTYDELLAMLNEPVLDRQKVISMLDSKTQKINQLAPEVVNAFGDFYDSLNQEQHKELREHFEDLAEYRGHYRDHDSDHHGKYKDDDDDDDDDDHHHGRHHDKS